MQKVGSYRPIVSKLKSYTRRPYVEIVSAHLLGEAIPGYQWMAKTVVVPTWGVFCKALCSRFGSSEYEDPEGSCKS